jgi:hypothetical protein
MGEDGRLMGERELRGGEGVLTFMTRGEADKRELLNLKTSQAVSQHVWYQHGIGT